MKLTKIAESSLSDAGHVALDIAGIVPGVGEAADATNALWYIKNRDYLSAALSLISMVPEIGDAVGKGAKYISKSKLGAKALAKYGPTVLKYWPKVLKAAETSKKFKPYARSMDQAIKRWAGTFK